jgi:predicted DNA-binding protein (MmcQ/YjbR family)
MNIEEVQSLCKQLPGVTEDIKWGSDLCFSVGGKMFLVTGLNQSPITASFKVTDEQPYLAKLQTSPASIFKFLTFV